MWIARADKAVVPPAEISDMEVDGQDSQQEEEQSNMTNNDNASQFIEEFKLSRDNMVQ